MKQIEETLKTIDGHELFALCWLPEGEIKGMLGFSHGIGEHVGRYHSLGEALAEEGYGLYMADLPGHGKSPGKKGHFLSWDELLNSLKAMVRRAGELAPGAKLFFGGHSFGGLNASRLLVDNPEGVNGGIIMSPAIKQVFDPPAFLMNLVRSLSPRMPGLRLPNFLDFDGLSRVEEVVTDYKKDPLVHKLISTRAFTEMEGAQSYIHGNAKNVTTPCLLIHGTADRLTSLEATESFFNEIGVNDKTLELLEGYYHETHNDLGKEMVYSLIVSWMNSH